MQITVEPITRWRSQRCRVCGKVFNYRDTERRYLCFEHAGSCLAPRGKYKIITFVDGLAEDQIEHLIVMTDRIMFRTQLCDLAQGGGMDGVVVQHVASGEFYKIESGQFVLIYKMPAG